MFGEPKRPRKTVPPTFILMTCAHGKTMLARLRGWYSTTISPQPFGPALLLVCRYDQSHGDRGHRIPEYFWHVADALYVSGTAKVWSLWISVCSIHPYDVNQDGKVDISDIVAVINTIAGDSTYKDTADTNGDKKTDISDIVAIINAIAAGD